MGAKAIKLAMGQTSCILPGFECQCRAVPRIFCLWGQTPHTPHRGLPYADRVSSWTLILFSLLHRKLPLRRLEKKKHTDTFSFKLS